ncbi:M28 family peptidase [Bacteroidota bacterium]
MISKSLINAGLKKIFLPLLAIMIFCFQAYSQDSLAIKYASSITEEDLAYHLKIVAADSMEGRETGYPGQKRAARYISKVFNEAGLFPITKAEDGFYQKFDLEKRTWKEIHIEVNGKVYNQFEGIVFFGNMETDGSVETDVVFGGQGDEDDLQGLDIIGKGVLIIATDGNERKKGRELLRKGANPVLVVNSTDDESFHNEVSRYRRYLERPSLDLQGESEEGERMVFYVSPTAAGEIFNTSFKTLNKAIERKSDGKKKALKKIKPSRIIYQVEKQIDIIETENVIGVLEGSGKKDECVIITAHYDHLGLSGDLIYNGADDDGSGTVAIMEIAEAFIKAKSEGSGPARSIVFMTVTGEEKGLMGSSYYVQNPVIPLSATVANLNIDMIGRSDAKHEENPNYVYLIGADKISDELHQISEKCNLTYTGLELDYTYNDENDPNRFYYRSDHYNFAKNNIPVIFYFTGVHEDYHRPTDTVDKIDFGKMKTITRLIFHTAWEVANKEERLLINE